MPQRLYCYRCRLSLSLNSFELERWENVTFQVCRKCINRLQAQGIMITSATALENEAMIQFILWEREGGEREVETPFGFVDLLTDEEVIEIKHIRNWKDASKVLVYASFFPSRKPRVHLFGGYSKELREMVEQAFAHLKISVTWEIDPY